MPRKPRTKKERHDHLGNICGNEINRAEGGQSDEIQANREKALKYYSCKPRGDERKGRSKVISSDVADMTNATLAMLVPMLANDCVVEFEPDGNDDEQQAKIESDVTNQVIIEDNMGYLEIQEAVKDALLLKNGCMKIRVNETQSVQRLPVQGATTEQVNAFILSQPQNVEAVRDGDEVVLTTTNRDFEVCAVPIENISYQAGYTGKLQDIRFFAERIHYTRSDLVELGVDKSIVDDLQPYSEAMTGTERERNQSLHEVYDAETRDQDIIDCYECYIRTDMDNDGISERYRVLVANQNKCLEYEQVDLLPYALGSPFLQPHRLTGESLAEHLFQTQDIKTAYHRQFIDNVSTINNGRYAYDPSQTAEEDVLNPKAGGGIRARNPSQSIVPIMVPDVTSGILAGLQYEDQRRSERGGASLDLLAADAQLVGETAHGIERQYASREALASMMGRNLAETLIRGIYMLTHEYLRRYANRPYTVRVNGQVAQTDPSQWPQRNRLNVKVGMSPGERGHLQNVLMQHVQLQAQAVSQGLSGILASPETIYRTTMDWLRMAGIDNPERHAIDPMSPEAQQAAQQQAESAQQQAQAHQRLIDRQMGIEERKIASDMQKHQGDLQHKYYDTDAEIAVAEAKISGQGIIDLEKQRISNEGNRQATPERGVASNEGNAG